MSTHSFSINQLSFYLVKGSPSSPIIFKPLLDTA
jgi:hypothetical protein